MENSFISNCPVLCRIKPSWFRVSNFEFIYRSAVTIFGCPLVPVVLLLAILLVSGLPSVLNAEEKNNDQKVTIILPHDFVEKNLKAFNERLRTLKEHYQEQYGSLFAATSPVDVESIAKELPGPTTLRLAIQYPDTKEEEEKNIPIENGDYFVDRMYGSTSVDQMYNLTEGYYFGRDGENMLVSSDVQTSQLLGLPQKAGVYLNGSIYWVSTERTSSTGGYGEMCCVSAGKEEYCAETSNSYPYRCIRKAYYEYCSQYARIPQTGYAWNDPRLYGSQLKLGSETAQGVALDARMKNATFSSPGKKTISFVSPRKYSEEETYRLYRSCIPKYSYRYYGYYHYASPSYGLEKAVIGYKPAGKTSVDFNFTSVAFKKFGFPGYEMDASYGKSPDLDFFYDPEVAAGQYSYYGSTAGQLDPYVLLNYGDAGGLKAVSASGIRAPVTWSTLSPGPFSLNDGRLSYKGGVGATKFRVTLGGYESVEHSITANLVDLVFDTPMGRNEVVPGKNHKVLIRVKGAADMSRYQVRLTGEGGQWAQSAVPFKQVGELWHAEGMFSVGFDGILDPAKLNKPVRITADIVRTADNTRIYTYENSKLATTYPALDKLELYAGVGRSTPDRVEGPMDLFVSYDTPKVVLSPKLSLKETGVFSVLYSMNEINPKASVEVASSNPAIVYITNEKVRLASGRELNTVNIIANAGEKIGKAKVTARMGGKDIDPAGYAQFSGDQSEIKSDPVEITVNSVFLIAESSSGRTAYKLMVIGPADMTKYQAKWTGEAMRTTPFKSDAWGFVSTLETTLRMDGVEIQKAGATVARLNVKTMSKKLNIRIIPPNPPVTVVNRVAVSDLGSLESITECKKNVGKQIELSGFNPGMAVDDYCKAEREKQKQQIRSEREEQKAFNRMVRDLNRQGQDLVVVSDTMRVGAAIKGDISAMGNTLFCRWSLQNKGDLELQSTITPIENVTHEEGACFNTVKGLKNGFNPETVIKIDLIMLSRPETPVVVTGERVVTYGGMLIR